MILTKWKIRINRLKEEVLEFPSNWNKDKVLSFLNTDIKVCHICGKIDIRRNHFSNCNPQQEALHQESKDNYYK